MKPIDLLETIGSIRDKYILDAHSKQSVSKKVLPFRKVFLIAAVIAMLLLLVGCVAVIMGLHELEIGSFTYEAENGETQSGDFISLQGYIDSDNYKASQEWNQFLAQYDPDGTLLNESEEIGFIPPIDYMAYLCYTPDMVKQIDDICSKYNLELLGPTYTANASTEIYTMLGIDSITAPGAGSGVNLGSGYYYRNGSFNLEGSLELADGDGILPGGIIFEYRCIKKTAFDGVALNIGDTEAYDQWNYTTSDGTEVLLAMSENKALIIAEKDNFFITINILVQHMTRAGLETAADAFIFTYTPQQPDPNALVEPDWYPEETTEETTETETVAEEVTEPQMEHVEVTESKTEQDETISTNDSSGGTAELLSSDEHILWEVLQNQKSFHSVAYGKSLTLAEYCTSESEVMGFAVSITQYTFVDMDNDGIQEAVVDFRFGENSQVMCMVLKWDSSSEIVSGTEFYHRQMSQIKEDGSFAYSGGGDNDGWAKLRWENDAWVTESVEDSSHKANIQWYSYPIIAD